MFIWKYLCNFKRRRLLALKRRNYCPIVFFYIQQAPEPLLLMKTLIIVFLLIFNCISEIQKPKVLFVGAHPDDDITCTATLFKISRQFDGVADCLFITNGEGNRHVCYNLIFKGGFSHCDLGELYYNLPLKDENVARKLLPKIRKMEALESTKITGVSRIWFLDEQDDQYTTDPEPYLEGGVWNTQRVSSYLLSLLPNYDFVFVFLPTKSTHGQHKAASILTLQAISKLKGPKVPVILGVIDNFANFTELIGYPITKVVGSSPWFQLDRKQKFGAEDKLNLRMIVNWVITSHKSQGSTQNEIYAGDSENFWFFELNVGRHGAIEKAREFFRLLSKPYGH